MNDNNDFNHVVGVGVNANYNFKVKLTSYTLERKLQALNLLREKHCGAKIKVLKITQYLNIMFERLDRE